MKIRIAVDARVSADRKRCLETCRWLHDDTDWGRWCEMWGPSLNHDPRGRPLRCRACLRREVRP